MANVSLSAEWEKFLKGFPTFDKSKTTTKGDTSKRTDSKVEEVKTPGKDLVALGQLFMNRPQRNPPMAPRVVGNAAQITPQLLQATQPQLSPLLALSRLIGGQ